MGERKKIQRLVKTQIYSIELFFSVGKYLHKSIIQRQTNPHWMCAESRALGGVTQKQNALSSRAQSSLSGARMLVF